MTDADATDPKEIDKMLQDFDECALDFKTAARKLRSQCRSRLPFAISTASSSAFCLASIHAE